MSRFAPLFRGKGREEAAISETTPPHEVTIPKLGLLALLALLIAPTGALSQRISSVRPNEVTLLQGEEARIRVSGVNLGGLLTGRVEERGTARSDVLVKVTPSRDGRMLTVTLSANRRARPSDRLRVVLAPRRRRRGVRPVTVPLRLSVKPREPQRTRAPRRRFTPVVFTTDPLVMTGRRFVPVMLGTDPLVMTGRRFVPVTLDTDPLVMTGRRFVPVTLDTETLRMTGLREEEAPQ